MADRDYKVSYKSRVLEKDEERPRVPTALDPYDNPYAEPPSRRRYGPPRDNTSTFDDDSSATTELARSTTRTTYTARGDSRPRDTYTDTRSSFKADAPPPDNVSLRRSIVEDRRRDEPSPRPEPPADSRTTRSRGYADVEIERPRGRARGYYVDDSPRPIGAPYIIDTRQGDVIDISVPRRERLPENDRDRQRYEYDQPRGAVYERDYDRGTYVRTGQDVRTSNTMVLDRDYPPPRSRYQYDNYRSPRSSTREYESNREEDWRLVDSMRDTRIGSTNPGEAYSEAPSRSRPPTQSSEDSYVMVSPRQAPRHRERSVSRSALARTDYSNTELRRRRSRSISFRDSQVAHHDASERRHERPGAEAEFLGPYLGRPMSDISIDDRSDTYATHNNLDSRTMARESDKYSSTYRERDEPYPPQTDYEPRRRDRSRRRRRDDDGDDSTYYSENITRKTTRETNYR